MALTGYPPEDLLLRPAFLAECRKQIGRLIDEVDDITLVIGYPFGDTRECFNCAIVIRDGHVLVKAGEMIVVPRGVEHKTSAETEAKLMLIEPRGVLNTGHEGGERTAVDDVWI